MERIDNIFSIKSDCKARSPVLLFTEEDFKENKSSQPGSSSSLVSQLSRLRQWEGTSFNVFSSCTTPKMRKPATMPNAPVKERKHCTKIELKPKKLMFFEDELASTVSAGSVFNVSSNLSFAKMISNSPTVCRLSRIEMPSAKNTKVFSHTDQLAKINRRTMYKENENENGNENIGLPISQKKCKKILPQNSSVGHTLRTKTISANNKLDWYNILTELQPERQVGLWVECCRKNCKKWRYVGDYCDPTEVPHIWYCEMNSDKTIASCAIPELPISPEIQDDLIENLYNAGSIVWAQIRGFPWWPGIVDDSPDTFVYYKLRKNSIKPFMYHVTFFDKSLLECAWISPRNLKPFVKNKYSDIVKTTKYRNIDYKERLHDSYNIALTAVPLTILQRLQKFSFVGRYKRLDADENLVPMEVDSSDEDIIPATPDTHTSLKELYLQHVHRSKSHS